MRQRIVVKLFLLTAALCTLILTAFLIGQTIFFKQYYADRKVDEMANSIQSFEEAYAASSGNAQAIRKLESDFYQEHHAWIAALDQYGNLKDVNDFYIEVQLDLSGDPTLSNTYMKVPVYYLLNIEDYIDKEVPPITAGMRISMYGVTKDAVIIPYIIGKTGILPPGTLGSLTPFELETINGQPFWENVQLQEKVKEWLQSQQAKLSASGSTVTSVIGTVNAVNLPNSNASLPDFLNVNGLFMEQIRAFQADLLLNNKQNYDSLQVLDYNHNDITYKLTIKPIKGHDEATTYLISMVSLQPVDDAMQMLKDYSIYMIGFALLLILLVSFYYSRKIAGPLLRINQTTGKIANLDFSENVPITSKDEIGDLSRNINLLSQTLHAHIQRLEMDIEKEKQLENTRKEFIAGVSHELKTPLSIMKGCISILKDGIVGHKRDYYFAAMDKEVDKMNLMIVDMLELARLESGTYRMEMDAFYIDEAIAYICEQLSSEFATKQLKVSTRLDQVKVYANQHRIEQVITNFITNAIRYTPEEGNIIISAIEEESAIKVSVENKGGHIENDQLDKIWERFYRVNASRQRSEGGTGLGLAISKNILELHDVPYGVTNTEDGVLFYFYLNKTA